MAHSLGPANYQLDFFRTLELPTRFFSYPWATTHEVFFPTHDISDTQTTTHEIFFLTHELLPTRFFFWIHKLLSTRARRYEDVNRKILSIFPEIFNHTTFTVHFTSIFFRKSLFSCLTFTRFNTGLSRPRSFLTLYITRSIKTLNIKTFQFIIITLDKDISIVGPEFVFHSKFFALTPDEYWIWWQVTITVYIVLWLGRAAWMCPAESWMKNVSIVPFQIFHRHQ